MEGTDWNSGGVVQEIILKVLECGSLGGGWSLSHLTGVAHV